MAVLWKKKRLIVGREISKQLVTLRNKRLVDKLLSLTVTTDHFIGGIQYAQKVNCLQRSLICSIHQFLILKASDSLETGRENQPSFYWLSGSIKSNPNRYFRDCQFGGNFLVVL